MLYDKENEIKAIESKLKLSNDELQTLQQKEKYLEDNNQLQQNEYLQQINDLKLKLSLNEKKVFEAKWI